MSFMYFKYLKKTHLDVIAIYLVTVCLVLHAFIMVHKKRNNTLANGNWISTKATLEKAVPGTYAFILASQALAGGHLDLGAWHGYQEVIYKRELAPKQIEFDFRLDPDAYLCLIYNKHESGFSGFRFSVNERFESMHFKASALGAFRDRAALSIPELKSGEWYHARVNFRENGCSLFVNGREAGAFIESIPDKQRVGFRGGFRAAWIDNVVIRQYDPSKRIVDSFSGPQNVFPMALLAAGIILLLNASFAWLFKSKDPQGYPMVYKLILMNLVLMMAGYALVVDYHVKSKAYPVARDAEEQPGDEEELTPKPAYWNKLTAKEVIKSIKRTYTPSPGEGVYRILFLGTSQTAGAGARKEEHILVRGLENLLNESAASGTSYECINGGINGLDSGQILEIYKREWLSLAPHTVIVNLAHNDIFLGAFVQNLEALLALNTASAIQTILVLEPISTEFPMRLSHKYMLMRRLAEKYHVQAVDMHAYLSAKYDVGFLWWDRVHLTSFGQELFAARLYDEIGGRFQL